MAVSPRSCGRCGAQNPPNQRFCGSCGANLANPLAAFPNAPAAFSNVPVPPGAPIFAPNAPGQLQPGIPVAVPYVPNQAGARVFAPYAPGPLMPAGRASKSIWSFGLTQVLALVSGAILVSIFFGLGENMLLTGGLRAILFRIGTLSIGIYSVVFLVAELFLFLSAAIGGPWVGPIVSTVKALVLAMFETFVFKDVFLLLAFLAGYVGEVGMAFVIGFAFAYARRRYGLAFGLSCLAILGGALFSGLSNIFSLLSLPRVVRTSVLPGTVIAQQFSFVLIEFLIVLALALAGKVIYDLIARNTETTPAT